MEKEIHNYGIEIDKNTLDQFKHCYSQDYVIKAALMPDAHSGYVAPIGAVLVSKDYVVPAWVGFDIGCGVTSAKLNIPLKKIKEHSKEIFEEVKKTIPMGLGKTNAQNNINRESVEEFCKLLKTLEEGPHDPDVFRFIKNKGLSNVGSLGEGNHFIEIGEFEDEAWITIHSGSRNLGHKVATKYMIKSSGKDSGYEETAPLKIDSKLGQEYLNVLDFCLNFALLNRKEMIKKAVECIETILCEKVEYEIWTNKNHNHAVLDEGNYVHRKGATPSKKGERGVIPGNMRDGVYLVEGLGNSEFLESSSHGAGRIMSRSQARKTITMDDFKESMKGVIGTVKEGTLDEAPAAYKNIFDVMDAQKESVKIIKLLKPIINWKGNAKKKRHY